MHERESMVVVTLGSNPLLGFQGGVAWLVVKQAMAWDYGGRWMG